MSHLIASYADSVRQSLSFDRQSANRLAAEVEDHLYEALACDLSDVSDDAAQVAIRGFGSPAELAATYTAQIFPERLKATGRLGLILAALVLLAMWLRRAFELLPWINGLPGTKTLLFADAVGFRVAVAVGIVAWSMFILNHASRHTPLIVQTLIVAAGALSLSIAASVVVALAAVVLSGWSTASIIAMISTLSACVMMVFLIAKIRMLRGYAALMARRPYRPNYVKTI
jgi:hypothetical protein